jgi:hypothetical protein
MSQYEVLGYLKEHAGIPVYAKELAERFHKNTTSINHNLRQLVKFYKTIRIEYFKRATGKAGSSEWGYIYEDEDNAEKEKRAVTI